MVDLDCPLSDCPFVIVDIETTGMKPPHARITEVGAVRLRGGEFGLELAQLIDPGCAIPPFITAMTGISDEMVAGQPTIEMLWPILEDFIGDSILVAHNARFDLAFLDHEAWRITGRPLANLEVCTVALSRRAWPSLDRHNLDSVAQHLGLGFDARHRALGDARVTAQVLHSALQILEARRIHTLGDLMRSQRSARCRARLRALFPDWIERTRPRPRKRQPVADRLDR
jgi:DNA polymerase-3 subunit epsilon